MNKKPVVLVVMDGVGETATALDFLLRFAKLLSLSGTCRLYSLCAKSCLLPLLCTYVA